MSNIDELGNAFLRLGCALAAGGILGWEREWRAKPAGLRTNMIVALGSALLVLLSQELAESMTDSSGWTAVDPSRVIQGIVGGIGFIGGGTILQSRRSIQGLTTASTIWLSSALGISSGLGYYILTIVAVALALIVLVAFGSLEKAVFEDGESHEKPQQSSE